MTEQAHIDDDRNPPEPEVEGNFREHPLADMITGAIRQVFDPEIPVNIYDLGLIYRIDVDDQMNIDVDMSLTAPGCPVAGEMPGMVSRALEPLDQVQNVSVQLVWDPPWTPDRMTEIAQLELGWF
ncbi:MAG: iron-sulfur cluster assembly protein [Pseudomonadota bacterium]